jgi:hypothetical protein
MSTAVKLQEVRIKDIKVTEDTITAHLVDGRVINSQESLPGVGQFSHFYQLPFLSIFTALPTAGITPSVPVTRHYATNSQSCSPHLQTLI